MFRRKTKTHRLSDLRLNAVALVDNPANPGATIEIFKRADIEKARNLGQWLEARLHANFTAMADELYGEGAMTRDERIALSGAIGDALSAFTTRAESDAPDVFNRDLYAQPESETAKGDPPPTPPEAIVPDAPTLEDVTKERDETKTALDAAKAELDALAKMSPEDVAALLGIEIAKAEPEVDVLKGLTPEAAEIVRKAQEDATAAQERIAKMEAAAERAVVVAKAKDFDKVPTSTDKLADLLAAVSGDAEVAKTLDSVLGAYAEGVMLTKEIGRSAGVENDAASQLRVRAEEIAKSDSLTIEQATAKAAAENPTLAYEATRS